MLAGDTAGGNVAECGTFKFVPVLTLDGKRLQMSWTESPSALQLLKRPQQPNFAASVCVSSHLVRSHVNGGTSGEMLTAFFKKMHKLKPETLTQNRFSFCAGHSVLRAPP